MIETGEAVEVEVTDEPSDTARVAMSDREGRARHRGVGTERASRSTDECCLACAELPRDEDEVAVLELPRQLGTEGLGRLDAVGLEAA